MTLGKSNFKNIDPAKTNPHIVLCLDNDGQNPQSDKLIHAAVEKLREQGKQVWIAQPAIAGQDYNDVLFQQGQAAVKEAMEKAVSYTDYCQSFSGTSIIYWKRCAGLCRAEFSESATGHRKSDRQRKCPIQRSPFVYAVLADITRKNRAENQFHRHLTS